MTACNWLAVDCICGRWRVCIPEGSESPTACPSCGATAILVTLLTTKAETSRTMPFFEMERRAVVRVPWDQIEPEIITTYQQDVTISALTDSESAAHHPAHTITPAVNERLGSDSVMGGAVFSR